MEPNQERSLIPQPSHELTAPQATVNRILIQMVDEALVLAQHAAAAPTDPDALVVAGKRLYCSRLKVGSPRAEELATENLRPFDLRLQSGLLRQEGTTEEDIQIFGLFYRAAKAGHLSHLERPNFDFAQYLAARTGGFARSFAAMMP